MWVVTPDVEHISPYSRPSLAPLSLKIAGQAPRRSRPERRAVASPHILWLCLASLGDLQPCFHVQEVLFIAGYKPQSSPTGFLLADHRKKASQVQGCTHIVGTFRPNHHRLRQSPVVVPPLLDSSFWDLSFWPAFGVGHRRSRYWSRKDCRCCTPLRRVCNAGCTWLRPLAPTRSGYPLSSNLTANVSSPQSVTMSITWLLTRLSTLRTARLLPLGACSLGLVAMHATKFRSLNWLDSWISLTRPEPNKADLVQLFFFRIYLTAFPPFDPHETRYPTVFKCSGHMGKVYLII